MRSYREWLVASGVFLACALPWLNAFTPGPWPNMGPMLFSLLCTGILLLLGSMHQVPIRYGVFFIGAAAVVLVHSALVGVQWWLNPLSTALALGLLLLLAMFARGAQAHGQSALLLWALFVAAVANSALALMQFFDAVPPGAAPWLYPADANNPSFRPFGNLRQPNQLATLTTIGLGAALALHTLVRGRLSALLLLLGVALLAVGNAVSLSRIGLLQILCAGVAMLWWAARLWRSERKRAQHLVLLALWVWAWYALTAGLMYAQGAAQAGAQTHSTFARLAQETNGQDLRWALWSNTLAVAAQRPYLGWGWGELAWALQKQEFAVRFPLLADQAHNLPLQLVAELGWPLALLCCWMLGLWWWRRKPWAETTALRQGALLMVLGMGLHSLVEYPLWYGPFLMTAGLAVGWLLRPAEQAPAQREGAAAGSGLPRRWTALLGLASVVLALWMQADWRKVSQAYLAPEQRDAHLLAHAHGDALALAQETVFFPQYADFAALHMLPLTAQNAAAELQRAKKLLHYSPEAGVLLRAAQAAEWAGAADEAAYYGGLLKRRHPQVAAQHGLQGR